MSIQKLKHDPICWESNRDLQSFKGPDEIADFFGAPTLSAHTFANSLDMEIYCKSEKIKTTLNIRNIRMHILFWHSCT